MDRSPDSVLRILETFIVKEKGALPRPLSLDTPLLKDGLIDSFAVVTLGEEFARAFGITVASGALIPEDFETPRLLWARLQELTAG